MTREYRMVETKMSGRPNENGSDAQLHSQEQQGRERPQLTLLIQDSPRGKGWNRLIAIGALAAAIVALFWIAGIADTAHALQQQVAQNAHAIAGQSAQLSGIQDHLNALGNQLNHLQSEIETFFASVAGWMHH